jgi:hypothetical protein
MQSIPAMKDKNETYINEPRLDIFSTKVKSMISPRKTKDKVGIAKRKLNLAEDDLEKPKNRAAMMVTADRDEPGIKANT